VRNSSILVQVCFFGHLRGLRENDGLLLTLQKLHSCCLNYIFGIQRTKKFQLVRSVFLRGARWSCGQCVQRAIAEAKHRS
jgi:hypothetical protein